jgi:hypothetical protein
MDSFLWACLWRKTEGTRGCQRGIAEPGNEYKRVRKMSKTWTRRRQHAQPQNQALQTSRPNFKTTNSARNSGSGAAVRERRNVTGPTPRDRRAGSCGRALELIPAADAHLVQAVFFEYANLEVTRTPGGGNQEAHAEIGTPRWLRDPAVVHYCPVFRASRIFWRAGSTKFAVFAIAYRHSMYSGIVT